MGICPGCGRCKECGRPYPQPYVYPHYVPPLQPYWGPYWQQPFVITAGDTSIQSQTITSDQMPDVMVYS